MTSYCTVQEVKDYLNNNPDIEITEEAISNARKMIDDAYSRRFIFNHPTAFFSRMKYLIEKENKDTKK